MADTDYERVYCEVIQAGQGAALPRFEDFRNNDVRVQALLLKRPAERLGIELPAPPVVQPQESQPSFQQPQPLSRESQAAPQTSSEESAQGERADASLNGCRLRGETIDCPDQRFELVSNQPNSALERGVLSEGHQMGLPRFNGDRADESAVHQYLSQAYDVYIVKMLSIGLGGATMSFTEFYHGFYRHEEQGVDFVDRMEATFQLLKQDKKNNAIQARFHDRLPETIDACMTVGRDLVVCDNVRTNWVYQRR